MRDQCVADFQHGCRSLFAITAETAGANEKPTDLELGTTKPPTVKKPASAPEPFASQAPPLLVRFFSTLVPVRSICLRNRFAALSLWREIVACEIAACS